MDETLFPEEFPEVGGKSYLWIYEHKKEFVEFVQNITNTTGLFQKFQDYVLSKNVVKK